MGILVVLKLRLMENKYLEFLAHRDRLLLDIVADDFP